MSASDSTACEANHCIGTPAVTAEAMAGAMGLVRHTNGIFYGPTIRGGKIVYHFCSAWCGTLFSLSVP